MTDSEPDATARRMAEMLPGWDIDCYSHPPRHWYATSPDGHVRCDSVDRHAWATCDDVRELGPNADGVLAALIQYLQQARAWLAAETAARETDHA